MSRELNPSMMEKRIYDLENSGGGAIEHITEVVESIDNSLIADVDGSDTHFYFDYKDGKLGFNTDELRGADTFHPFSNGGGGAGFVLYDSGVWNDIDFVGEVQKSGIIENADNIEIPLSAGNGSGIIFAINKNTNYDVVVYFEDTPANIQFGIGSVNSVVPNVISLGEGRVSYANYLASMGEKVHILSAFDGKHYYIGKYTNGQAKIKKIVII